CLWLASLPRPEVKFKLVWPTHRSPALAWFDFGPSHALQRRLRHRRKGRAGDAVAEGYAPPAIGTPKPVRRLAGTRDTWCHRGNFRGGHPAAQRTACPAVDQHHDPAAADLPFRAIEPPTDGRADAPALREPRGHCGAGQSTSAATEPPAIGDSTLACARRTAHPVGDNQS